MDKKKTYKTNFDVYLPATDICPPVFIKTIEVEMYDNFGEQVLTPESSDKIERVKKGAIESWSSLDDALAEIEWAKQQLWKCGLLPSAYPTLRKSVQGVTEIVNSLRRHLTNPPPDVQEKVLEMLGIFRAEKKLDELDNS